MRPLAIFALALAASTAVLQAGTLVGSTVTINWLYPSSSQIFTTDTVTVVSPGAEISCPSGYALCGYTSSNPTIDIGALSITQSFAAETQYLNTAYNGYQFAGLNFGAGESLSSFLLSTNIFGLDASRVSLTGDSIAVNLHDLDIVRGSFWTLDLVTATGEVPEPATFALVGSGLLGTALLGLRRLRRA